VSFKLIYGRGGSGKTKEIYEEIKRRRAEVPDRTMLLLVPDQYTFRAEQKVLKELGKENVFHVTVYSFSTMIRKILQSAGGATHELISDLGKSMLMTKALAEVEEKLVLFRHVARKPGFVELAKNLADEMKRSRMEPEKLREAIDASGDPELKQKFDDILLFFETYENEVHKGHVDSMDEMTFAGERMHKAEFLKNAEVYIDEFNDFSLIQLSFIEHLMRNAHRVVMTLTMDKDGEMGDVFRITKDTEDKLFQIAERAQVSIEKPLILTDEVPLRFRENEELAHLEREYFMYPNKIYHKEPQHVSIYKAQNTYDEVEKVALDIRRRIREDETLRYRDLAILCRNIDAYESILTSVFREHEIPLFLDKRREMDGSPISQYILALVDIAKEGFTYDALFKLLKTGLSHLEKEEVDLLENYVLANGIKGGNYEKSFVYPYPNIVPEEMKALYLDKTNDVRSKITEVYQPLRTMLENAQTAEEISKVLYEHLEEHGVLHRSMETVSKLNDLEVLKEHEETLKGIITIFDDLVEVLGQEKLSLEMYGEVLQQAMISHKIALIPLTLDQVILGDVARVKSDSIRGLYILGVNDGIFPRTVSDEGIITDHDIEKLKAQGLNLLVDSKLRSVYEQFLVYTAFSIPREFLALSYPGADLDGKSQRPSLVIGRIKKLFPKLMEKTYINPMERKSGGIEEVESKVATFNELIKEMRRNYQGDKVNPLWGEVYQWFSDHEDFSNRLKISREGLSYTNVTEKLSRSSVKELYGEQLYLSVSRLERYTSCPFAYYIQYGLKAKDRVMHEVTAPDVGTLMHEVIDQFTEDLRGMERDLSKVDKTYIRAAVDRLVDEAIEKTNTIYKSSPRYKHMGEKVKKIIHRSVETITAQIAKGKFVPMFNELGFGKEGEKLPALSIEIPDTGEDALLRGRIDRIDVMEMDGKSYIRIIDYKSSAKDVSLQDVFYGLQLQLLVYLDVVLRNWESLQIQKAVPGAVLYFKMDNPVISGNVRMTDEEIERKVLESLRLKGLLLKDAKVIRSMDEDIDTYSLVIPAKISKDGEVVSSSNRKEKNEEIILTEQEFDVLREYVLDTIGRILKELFDGNIAIEPYKNKDKIPCTYCTYKSICQFDGKIKANKYRTLKAMTIEELWEKMKKGENALE
jgi:ATP-dependent helicase/nuclease subunit B